VRILVIFQERLVFSHNNGKLSPRPYDLYGCTIMDIKNVPLLRPPIGALRLPTLAPNQAGDWLMPSKGMQPQRTDI